MLGRSLSCVRATCRPWALHLFESGVDIACGSAVEAFKSTSADYIETNVVKD